LWRLSGYLFRRSLEVCRVEEDSASNFRCITVNEHPHKRHAQGLRRENVRAFDVCGSQQFMERLGDARERGRDVVKS
jgi:hypothetical protein